MAFNGHAHTYQRNIAPPGGVISYTTGGGGAKATSLSSTCSPTDAYGIGWSYTKSKGTPCGAAPAPASDSQVYHFLKVRVSGSTVSVTPTDSRGHTFDVQSFNFAADTTRPSAPGGLTYTQPSSTKVALSWTAASDNVGVSAYDIYRNGVLLATVPPGALGYTDATAVAGSAYTYRVDARDLAGNTTGSSVAVNGGTVTDTTPPSTPTGVTAGATGPTSIGLSWSASTDNVGVTGYSVLRGGTQVATVGGTTTSWSDTGLTPGTAYTYQVTAKDAAGNSSAPSAPATATTSSDTSAPTAPGTPTVTSDTASAVSLSWTASTDNIGVVRYDVLRNGSVVGTASGTTFTDTTVAPGSTYSYAVRAFDAAGNSATSGSVPVTTPATGSVFSDGFESGDLSAWTTLGGLSVQNQIVHTGGFAARETSTGTATYAYKTLSASASELWAQAWVYVASRSTSATLIGFRGSGGSIVALYVDTSGRVSLRNNVGSVTTNSTTTMPLGSWHRMVLHALVNGTSSSLSVSMDGVTVPGLTLTGQDLGTSPITRLQLGDTATGRTYDIVLDDVVVSPSAL